MNQPRLPLHLSSRFDVALEDLADELEDDDEQRTEELRTSHLDSSKPDDLSSERRLANLRAQTDIAAIYRQRERTSTLRARAEDAVATEVANAIYEARSGETSAHHAPPMQDLWRRLNQQASSEPRAAAAIAAQYEAESCAQQTCGAGGWAALFAAFDVREQGERERRSDERFGGLLREEDVDSALCWEYLGTVLLGAAPTQRVLWNLREAAGVNAGGVRTFSLGRASAAFVRGFAQVHQCAGPTIVSESGESPKSAEERLAVAISDTVGFRELMMAWCRYCYPALTTARIKEGPPYFHRNAVHLCLERVEEAVVAPLSPLVFALMESVPRIAQANLAISSRCAKLSALPPHRLLELIGVRKSFRKMDQEKPYSDAVDALRAVWHEGGSPCAKLRHVVSASRAACAGAAEVVGADDLLPIWLYCVIASKPCNLASQVAFMRQIASDEVASGEVGYALALIESSLQGVLNVCPDVK